MGPPLVTAQQERSVLERCLTECKRRLDHFREVGNKLQADLAEADLNDMLDELRKVSRHRGVGK